MSDLKPCPFCGRSVEILGDNENMPNGDVFIVCCASMSEGFIGKAYVRKNSKNRKSKSIEILTNRWNKRSRKR